MLNSWTYLHIFLIFLREKKSLSREGANNVKTGCGSFQATERDRERQRQREREKEREIC